MELASLRCAASLAPDDAHAFGTALYRAQRLAMGESGVQDTFLHQGR